MVWRLSLFASSAVAATFVASTALVSPASAQPPANESSEATGCRLDLSPPQLMILPDGGKAVGATLDPATCAPTAQPTDVRVCLSTPTGPGDCKRTPGWSTAQVLVAPSPGTFTVTGQICWLEITRSFQTGCRNAGPLSATF